MFVFFFFFFFFFFLFCSFFFFFFFFFFQAEDGIRVKLVTGVQTCALPIYLLLCFPVRRVLPRSVRLQQVKKSFHFLFYCSFGLFESMTFVFFGRSEERRVGKECMFWWWVFLLKKKKK